MPSHPSKVRIKAPKIFNKTKARKKGTAKKKK